ncbi:DUF4160 domain-containing protein [Nitratireductor sp. ZSWI3]|uniref:DUF4160 domain-containing protein n=1 Tax=Nitratireductor sp. ZSWI3 TaxID=2966359 RepID=UPI00214F9625|nr:DUF4160 domain-containing protein [Nitratireductor sp. ZSWI3]MCR4267798.1 DUF4160 domain-containing protein [Nitratireductor sp. ZSWI3]
MPLVFREGPYRIFFYSNEGDPREPMHVHVRDGEREAKVWLYPSISIAESFGFNSRELGAIISIIETNRARIEQAWHEHFGD